MKRLLLSFAPVTIIALVVIGGWANFDVNVEKPWASRVPDLPTYPGALNEARAYNPWGGYPERTLSFTTADKPDVVWEKYKNILQAHGWTYFAQCPLEFQLQNRQDGAMGIAKILTTAQEDGSTKVDVQVGWGVVSCDVIQPDLE
jgi:hypothetical protein